MRTYPTSSVLPSRLVGVALLPCRDDSLSGCPLRFTPPPPPPTRAPCLPFASRAITFDLVRLFCVLYDLTCVRFNSTFIQDRDYTIPSLPAELQGLRLTCVQTAQGDKRAGGSRLWRLSLMQVHDYRGGARPSLLRGGGRSALYFSVLSPSVFSPFIPSPASPHRGVVSSFGSPGHVRACLSSRRPPRRENPAAAQQSKHKVVGALLLTRSSGRR